jgi:phosphoribosyl-ATP pyrophosphohydrolase
MDVQPSDKSALTGQVLDRLATTIESRLPDHGGDANASYVARLLQRGPDAFLKKIGEEATEVVMASKDLDVALAGGAGVDDRRAKLVGEVADLWFHCMVALAHYGLRPSDVTDELARREGTSGIEEKALRKAIAREGA